MNTDALGPARRLAVPSRLGARWRLRRAVRRAAAATSSDSLTDYELGVCSQNGEDGVLQELLRRLGAGARFFVEFGASRGEQANCVLLADVYGWRGLFIESDAEEYAALERKYAANPRVTTEQAVVTVQTIEPLLDRLGVPDVFDVLSIDIDGNDFWVWQALQSFAGRIVVIEYNANLPLHRQLVMPRDDGHQWDGSDYFGASLGALRALASEKGYELIHTERTGANAFFVRREETHALSSLRPAPARAANYFGRGVRLPKDPKERPFRDLESGELVNSERLSLPRRPAGS